jgi:hypothetical protein
MVKTVKFVGEYNEWGLEQYKRQEDGHWVSDLTKPVRKIRLLWHINFGKFFIHIGRDIKRD